MRFCQENSSLSEYVVVENVYRSTRCDLKFPDWKTQAGSRQVISRSFATFEEDALQSQTMKDLYARI